MEWAQGEGLRFLLSYTSQRCRDTWFHPTSLRGHPIDHLLCRERDHRFLGASKVLFEDPLGTSWSAYTDHNPVEVKLANLIAVYIDLTGRLSEVRVTLRRRLVPLCLSKWIGGLARINRPLGKMLLN